MSETWWHQWKGELPDDGGTISITLGPTSMGPDDHGHDDGLPVRERTFPLELFADLPRPLRASSPEMTYVGSFHHDPEFDEEPEL